MLWLHVAHEEHESPGILFPHRIVMTLPVLFVTLAARWSLSILRGNITIYKA